MKLTMVSFSYRGKRFTFFINLPVGDDGKMRADAELVKHSLNALGCYQKGATFSIG